MSEEKRPTCTHCSKDASEVGAIIQTGDGKGICDECIVQASDMYAGFHKLPPGVILDTMRYRIAMRRIAERQKQVEAEMRKAEQENPELAHPNAGMDAPKN